MATSETVREIGRKMAQQQQAARDAVMAESAAMNPDNQTPFQAPDEFMREQARKIANERLGATRDNTELAKQEEQRVYDQLQSETRIANEAAETNRKRTDAVDAQTHEQNVQRGMFLLKQVQDLNLRLAPYQGKTQDTLPLDLLREATNLGQEWANFREGAQYLNLPAWDASSLETGIGIPRVPQQEAVSPLNQKYPETFEDGRYSRLKQNEDGSLVLEISNGTKYKAKNLDEMAEQLAKSNVHMHRYSREQRAIFEQQQPAQQPQTSPQLDQSQPQYSSIAYALAAEQAEAFARQLGFSNKAELMQWGERYEKDRAMMENIRNEAVAADFLTKYPEFPNTDAASDAVAGVIAEQGWEYNADTLAAAHAIATRRGLYQPLSQEQIAFANGAPPVQHTRPTPPPLVRGGGNPEMNNQAPDPWSMNLADLRKQAIKAQLGEGQ